MRYFSAAGIGGRHGWSRTVITVILAYAVSLRSVFVEARPVVRNIQSAHEFDRLLKKHASETGLPVVVDYYSDSCGPCRMMAPIFKKVAQEYIDKAVFVKVDTNAQYELSSRYQIRSLPTFQWFLNGKKVQQQVGGIGEGPLRQQTDQLVRQAEVENVKITVEALTDYYKAAEPSKKESDIVAVHKKCADMNKGANECVGSAANQLARRLRQKYKSAPKTEPRFSADSQKAQNDKKESSSSSSTSDEPRQQRRRGASSSSSAAPNLHLATKEQLKEELEKRLDEERDQEVEAEDEDEDEPDPDFKTWTRSSFPERMVIIGGGPAGLAAAIYGARAGLTPLVIAPSMGGQLQGKGVDVENYPALHNMTGPGLVASMRRQAGHFGAVFEDDTVLTVDASERPLKVTTNNTGTISTHTIIIATGAEANWLGVKGEWELRGGGVSSCATCDGFLYSHKHVLVVGGGDAAMEDALVLARTSKSVTILHRRDRFRASKVLADRVLNHPLITVRWNAVVEEILGKEIENNDNGDETEQDLDNLQKVVSGVRVKDTVTGETSVMNCDAVFVAIGHTPATNFLKGVVEMDEYHSGYLKLSTTSHHATQTSVEGIFAAGDVCDPIYRQAITSAGQGAAAALDAERYLSENGLGNEAAELEAELMKELMESGNGAAAAEEMVYNAYEEAGGRMAGMKESLASEL